MAVLHISEMEFAWNTASLLDRVEVGTEIVIERDHKPAAVRRAATPRGRKLSEIIVAFRRLHGND
jgi:antitoxin (DNA-binding transcriptional repressor) of toxin-antitoxin stability system